MNILKKQLNFRNVSVLFLIVYFAVFLFYPIYKAFAGSLHDWNPLTQKYNYIGWENYRFVLGDKLFWKSLTNTLFFTAISTVLRLAVGLALALMLFSRMTKMRTFFQGLFYMPTVTPMVAVSFVWMWMFNPQFGLINRFFHLDINWLKNSNWAMIAIIIMTVWKDFGYATVLFLAGLMGLPEEVYEASRIDGANGWQTFKNITLPLLKPVTLFVTITSLISYFQTYIQILISQSLVVYL